MLRSKTADRERNPVITRPPDTSSERLLHNYGHTSEPIVMQFNVRFITLSPIDVVLLF